MKKLIGIMCGLLLVAGCKTTPPGQTPAIGGIVNCQQAQALVAKYDALAASGLWKPSEDEKRVAANAKLLVAILCGDAKLVSAPRSLAPPRQPEKVDWEGRRYVLHDPWRVVWDPTGVFARSIEMYGLATVTVGPYYVPEDGEPSIDEPPTVWMLPLAYERDTVGKYDTDCDGIDEVWLMHPLR